MINQRIIKEWNNYRIIERQDWHADANDLKGDCYNYEKFGYTGTREELLKKEKQFENLVSREGVFGYILEKWNPETGKGWEHVESCWGFVGQYSPTEETFNHYIIEELERVVS